MSRADLDTSRDVLLSCCADFSFSTATLRASDEEAVAGAPGTVAEPAAEAGAEHVPPLQCLLLVVLSPGLRADKGFARRSCCFTLLLSRDAVKDSCRFLSSMASSCALEVGLDSMLWGGLSGIRADGLDNMLWGALSGARADDLTCNNQTTQSSGQIIKHAIHASSRTDPKAVKSSWL